MAIAESDGNESGAKFVEFFAFGKEGMLAAAALFSIADAADLGDMRFYGIKWLVGGVEEEVEGVAVEVVVVFG